MALSASDIFSVDDLLDRLTEGVKRTNRAVVFLVGSPVTAPHLGDGLGVPNVAGVIDLIRNEFDIDRQNEFDSKISGASNEYQAAFSHLLARRGQNVVNDVVKKAVWKARKLASSLDATTYVPSSETDDDVCKSFDSELEAWHLPPAVASLGALVSAQPDLFGNCVLTTNFDPLIEVAVSITGGAVYRTVLHRDADVGQTHADGCHVVHLHGYWHGADTLHTPRQLTQDRPRLKASLARLIRSKTLVVCGYGGWDDTFSKTLFELIQDDRENTEVIWCLFGDGSDTPAALIESLRPGLDRGVVTIYGGIDCHTFLPRLQAAWGASLDQFIEPLEVDIGDAGPTAPSEAPEGPREPLYVPGYVVRPDPSKRLIFAENDQDRPPIIDFYVGREGESLALDESPARVVYLTGIGGEGKSALAADYFSRHHRDGRYDYVIWRDCKEESERFDLQLASIVHILGHRQVSLAELSQRPADDLIELFVRLATPYKLLMVFDNVDHYVDLEGASLTGLAFRFADRIEKSNLTCRVIYTCRPKISTIGDHVLEIRLGGISLESTQELFRLRNVLGPAEDIVRAHELTGGHAFWLDLMAAQAGKNADGPRLDELLNTAKLGESGLPIATLQSIWASLKEREQTVLRGLAEAVRPLTVAQLADYLTGHVRWNQLSKAVRYLRSLNLIVIKIQDRNVEVLELHPIIRAFVRKNVARGDQSSIVDSILKSYLAFFGIHRTELSKRPRETTIERWIEAAEVAMQAERYDQAFEYLHDVKSHFQSTGHTLDFVRVSYSLVNARQWNSDELPKFFDDVFNALMDAASSLGRDYQCLPLMELYRETIPKKNARYINYCDLMCNYYWTQGDFMSALKWGVEGVELKKSTDVDTDWDASHVLALAQRDSGAVDTALNYFLKSKTVDQVVNDPIEKVHGGAFYGNIGRCLHLMGQIGQAMACYKKSAILIEEEVAEASLANRGYIRQWVGEMAYRKGDKKLASACFSASMFCWDLIAPPKAVLLARRLHGHDEYEGLSSVPRDIAEKLFAAWMREL